MTANTPISIRIGANAHPGKVREENQDRISRFRCPFGEVFLVVDGMGGHEGGAIAAQMLIHGMETSLQELPPQMPPDEALRIAAGQTNADIYRQATSGDPQTAKMGATCVIALLNGRQVTIGHAGDSRAYLLRGGQLSALTRDHTVVQRMIEHDMLTEEEARHHPDASVVTRAFGQKSEVELEVSRSFEVFSSDRLLLCSDGLCGYVDDEAIQRVLGSTKDAQGITDGLIDLALQSGGEDNISVQVIAVEDPAPAGVYPAPIPAKRRYGLGLPRSIPTIALLLVAAFLVGTQAPWAPLLSKFFAGKSGPRVNATDDADLKQGESQGRPEVENMEQEVGEQEQEETFSEAQTGDAKPGIGDGKPLPVAATGEPESSGKLVTTPTPDETGSPAPPMIPLERLGVLGEGSGELKNKLSKLTRLGSIHVIRSGKGGSPFAEGYVYYRGGYETWANEILSQLRTVDDPQYSYNLKPWPQDLKDEYDQYQVIISAGKPRTGGSRKSENRVQGTIEDVQRPEEKDAGPAGENQKIRPAEPSPEREPPSSDNQPTSEAAEDSEKSEPTPRQEDSRPQRQLEPVAADGRSREANPPPKVGVTPAGDRIWWVLTPKHDRSQRPESIPERVKKNHEGRWLSPKVVPSNLAKVVKPGFIYFQLDFDEAARQVAGEMGYTAQAWPATIPREYRSRGEILIVLKLVASDSKQQRDGNTDE